MVALALRGRRSLRFLGRAELWRRAAICTFPEGKLSRGERLRARTGVSRLAAACPEARIVLCTVAGATDFVRFPKRPHVNVEFLPTAALPSASEAAQEFAAALLEELRRCVPPQKSGRSALRAGRDPVLRLVLNYPMKANDRRLRDLMQRTRADGGSPSFRAIGALGVLSLGSAADGSAAHSKKAPADFYGVAPQTRASAPRTLTDGHGQGRRDADHHQLGRRSIRRQPTATTTGRRHRPPHALCGASRGSSSSPSSSARRSGSRRASTTTTAPATNA